MRIRISEVPKGFCRAKCNALHEARGVAWCGHALFDNPEGVCLASREQVMEWMKSSRSGLWPGRG